MTSLESAKSHDLLNNQYKLSDTDPSVQSGSSYSSQDSGERKLAALGYTQELNRGFSTFTNFAVSFSIISILTGITGERCIMTQMTQMSLVDTCFNCMLYAQRLQLRRHHAWPRSIGLITITQCSHNTTATSSSTLKLALLCSAALQRFTYCVSCAVCWSQSQGPMELLLGMEVQCQPCGDGCWSPA